MPWPVAPRTADGRMGRALTIRGRTTKALGNAIALPFESVRQASQDLVPDDETTNAQ